MSNRSKIVATLLALLLLVSSCSASDKLHDPVYFAETNSDQIYLGGEQLLIPAYGEMYCTTITDITYLTIAGVYYKEVLTTITGEQKGFTSDATGRMTYNDITPNRIALVTCAMSLYSDIADVVITAKLYINGIASASSPIKLCLLDARAPGVMTLTALVILQPGDYIEVWLMSNTANVKSASTGYNFTVTTVD